MKLIANNKEGSVTTEEGSVTTEEGSVTTEEGSIATEEGSIETEEGSVITQQYSKKVSFRDEIDSYYESDTETSSSLDSGETFLPPFSSMSRCPDFSDGSVSSRRSHNRPSVHVDTKNVKNVLMKRYSKLAYSVQGVREGQQKKNRSLFRLKR
jgi:hypothetical protein